MGTQLSTINNLCVGKRKCIHSDSSTNVKPLLSEFGLFGKALYQQKEIEKEKIVTLFDSKDKLYKKTNSKKRKRQKHISNKPKWGTKEYIKYNKNL